MTLWTVARLLCPWDSLGKNTGVGCHFLLQGILPTQGSNPGLLHCRQILYHLSHQGNRRKRGINAFPLPSSAGSLGSPGVAVRGPVRQRSMCASVCVCVCVCVRACVAENTHHPLAAGAFQAHLALIHFLGYSGCDWSASVSSLPASWLIKKKVPCRHQQGEHWVFDCSRNNMMFIDSRHSAS